MLHAWRRSPARFREDANAEEDLRIGGYRDRVLVELAQNAADAAGSGGELLLTVEDGELRAANTGRPLDAAGVEALATLRASAKRDGGTVGHFGVGFAAVLAVTDAPSVRSANGGVRFSAADTRAAVAAAPELADALADRDGGVPVLRLPWPCGEPPPDGFATEVRLPLRASVDGAALLAEAARLAPDLLLALPGLAVITVGTERFAGTDGWVTVRRTGSLTGGARDGLGVEDPGTYAVTWAVRVDADGAPIPGGPDVLHTPTPTDERTSLPARLLATVPTEPGRRRVRAGAATGAVFATAADAYVDLLRAFPARQRLDLVPLPGFPLSEVDGSLRDAVLRRCASAPVWAGADGTEVAAAGAVALELRVPALTGLLADVVPGLLAEPYSPPLAALGVRCLGAAGLAEAVLGIDRTAGWWHDLYAALDEAGADRDELGALPVPLLDGRCLPGPRGVLLPGDDLTGLPGLDALGLPIAAPEAVHPLLRRLGAVPASAADVLDADPVRAAVERSVADAEAGLDVAPLADVVLRLADGHRPWLGALALPDTDGEPCRADELLLPDARLRAVLDPDALGVLAADYADRYPREALVAVGVLDGFTVVDDAEPTGPDHDLDAEDLWWADQPRVLAVRDLDLVADDRWPAALAQIAAEPDTRRALVEPGGHTGWWLARYATLAGHPPRHWRLPGTTALAGLYDELPAQPPPAEPLPADVLAAAGVRTAVRVESAADAADLLARLADPDRDLAAGTVLRAHAELAAAVRDGRVEPADVDPPAAVRTADGLAETTETTEATDAMDATGSAVVADEPWYLGVLSDPVVVHPFALAEPLARLLDLPLASESRYLPDDEGDPVPWSDLGALAEVCALLGAELPPGSVIVHDPLRVDGVPVPWWVDRGVVHADDSEPGLARALAWTLDRWADRHRILALLADPTPATLLG